MAMCVWPQKWKEKHTRVYVRNVVQILTSDNIIKYCLRHAEHERGRVTVLVIQKATVLKTNRDIINVYRFSNF